MKIYKNVLRTALTILLMTNFCYGMEPQQPASNVSISNPTGRPMLSLPETKKLPPLNLNSLAEWTNKITDLKTQLTTMIKYPSQRALIGSHLSDNSDWITGFIKNYFPNDAINLLKPLPEIVDQAKKTSLFNPTN